MSSKTAIAFLTCVLVTMGCGEDTKKQLKPGVALGVPDIEPPVSKNLPTGFKLSNFVGFNFQEADARTGARTTLISYMSTAGGNVSPLARLKAIDSRMDELDMRSQQAAKVCLEKEAATFTLPGTIPGGEAFAMKMQCRDDLDGGTASQLAFGKDATNFYLFERTSTSTNGVLAIAPLDGSSIDAWAMGVDGSSGAGTWVHIQGSLTKGVVEYTYAGETKAKSQAMVCGVRVKANSNYLYAVGKFLTQACGEEMTFCLDASGAEVATSLCEAAGLTTFSVAAIKPESTGVTATNVNAFLNKVMTDADVHTFLESVEEEVKE